VLKCFSNIRCKLWQGKAIHNNTRTHTNIPYNWHKYVASGVDVQGQSV
jgi:hypothetical protein